MAQSPGLVVTTLGGSYSGGFADGPAAIAAFYGPEGVAVDAAGTIYVGDRLNERIRKITPDGMVSTLAGSGQQGFADGPAASAQFRFPRGVAVDAAGTVYVTDSFNERIRKVAPDGMVSTFAGSGVRGFADGPAASAQFDVPWAVAVDTAGVVYVADRDNIRIRRIAVAAAPAPAAPANLQATPLDSSHIRLDWTSTAANVDGFHIYDALANIRATTVPATTTSYTLSNLVPDSRYCVVVYAYNQGGLSPPSNEACAYTPP